MPATLLDALASKATTDRDALLVEYREILARDAAGDAKRLAAVIDGLGLTVDDVRRDQGAISDATRARAGTRTPEQIDELKARHKALSASLDQTLRDTVKRAVDDAAGTDLEHIYREAMRAAFIIQRRSGNCWAELETGAHDVRMAAMVVDNARQADRDARQRIATLVEKHPRVADLIAG